MSWAEDQGYDAYDPEDAVSSTKEYEWEDKRHNVSLIHDLDTDHIKNILRGLGRQGAHNIYWGQRWKIPYLKKELEKRNV